MAARRWWQTPGPWTVRLEPPGGGPGPVRWWPAWGALLAGGELDMPLPEGGPARAQPPKPHDAERPSTAGPAPSPRPTPGRPRTVRLASLEAALSWSRQELARSPAGWTVGLWAGMPPRLRWCGRSEQDLRQLAREVAGWQGEPPRVEGAASAEEPASTGPTSSTPTSTTPTSTTPTSTTPASTAPAPGAWTAEPALSPAQQRVVQHDAGRAVVVAVAGAGKTTTMVARLRHRVRVGLCDPATLLVLSFSRSAVAALLGKLAADPALAAVEARTFHSLAYLLLRQRQRLGAVGDAASAPPSSPLGGSVPRPSSRGPPLEQMLEAVARAARREAEAVDRDLAQAWKDVDLEAFRSYRGRCLARLELPGLGAAAPRPLALPTGAKGLARPLPPDPDHPDHPRLLEDFERKRFELGWLDHDQVLVEAWLALHGDERLLAWARRRWRAAVVDEAQDLNQVQLAILEATMEGRADVVLVGDDAQAIYGFRGASPGLLRSFAQHHGAAVLVLDRCFRCRPEPLAAAASLVAGGPAQPRSARGMGGRLSLDQASGPRAQAEALVGRLHEHHGRGLPWSEQAVLLRRFDQSPAIELAAGRAGVPLRLEGVPPLAGRPAVLNAWAGLLLATGLQLEAQRPALRERLWRRWLLGPAALPSPVALASARRLAAGDPLPGAEAWARAAPRGADPAVGARLQRLAELAREDLGAALLQAAEDPRRWPARPDAALLAHLELLEALLHGSALGSALGGAAPGGAAPDAPAEAGGEPPSLAAAFRLYRAQLRSRGPRDAVLLTSVHRAKGLEWTVVHVPGMNAGTFPTGNDPEEERLAYVAWTRAREQLHLYRDRLAPASPFLAKGGVEELIALQDDLAWMRAAPQQGPSPPPLAARWAQREAVQRFGQEASGAAALDKAGTYGVH